MKKDGFSLLELSIVLVIIGLIAGGIVAGAAMIRAAELRAVITEKTQFETALNTFRDKYLGIPGDLKNATAFWGVAAGTTGLDDACWDTVSTGEETCNGNGDGKVSLDTTEYYEQFRAFQHLANAGLISGTYSGVGNDIISSSFHSLCDAGVNCPSSKLSGSAWQIRDRPVIVNANEYPRSAKRILYFGDTQGSTINPHGAVLTTEEAWNIDTKMDDGKPAYGSVHTIRKGATASWTLSAADCATDADPTVAEYDLQRDGVICSLTFILN